MTGQQQLNRWARFDVYSGNRGDETHATFLEKGAVRARAFVYGWEVRGGACFRARIRPAEFARPSYVGEISGHGVNAFCGSGGNIRELWRFVRDFGVLQGRKQGQAQ